MTSSHVILAIDATGREFFYTGRAGDFWMSENAADAFRYNSLEAARRKAMIFNRATALHGLHCMVPVGERQFA